jgi:HEAT repeat protein
MRIRRRRIRARPSDSVYWSAAQALGRLREPTAEDPIQTRLGAERDSYKRQKLKEALKRIRAAK